MPAVAGEVAGASVDQLWLAEGDEIVSGPSLCRVQRAAVEGGQLVQVVVAVAAAVGVVQFAERRVDQVVLVQHVAVAVVAVLEAVRRRAVPC